MDAQAEKNEWHGENRVKTGAATSEESQRYMSPFCPRGPSGWGGVIVRGGGNPEQHQTNAKHCKDQKALNR